MDPDIHAPQIDPTPTGTSTSPRFELPSFSLWSSTTQRSTCTTTHQSHHVHLLSDTSTLMQCKKKILVSYSQAMYISENTSISLPFKSTKGKNWQFLGLAIFSAPLLNSSPLSFCNRSSTLHQTQRKISSTAKLPSTKLPNPSIFLPPHFLPKISPCLPQNQPSWSFSSELRSFLLEASPFL